MKLTSGNCQCHKRQDLTDDKSTLVQVMALCHQAKSHYLNQCWANYIHPCDIGLLATMGYCLVQSVESGIKPVSEWMSTNMHNAIWHYQTTVKDWIHASVTQGDVLVVDIVQCRPWLHIIVSVEYTFSQIYKYTILIKYTFIEPMHRTKSNITYLLTWSNTNSKYSKFSMRWRQWRC